MIADLVRDLDSTESVGRKICDVAVDLLDATAVSIALFVQNTYTPIAQSDDLAGVLDEQQFALGDGPTFEACKSTIPIIVDDIRQASSREQSPAFAHAVELYDVRGIFAFPLRIGNAYIGALTAYRLTTGTPNAQEYSDGLILALLSTAELVRLQAGADPEGIPEIFEAGFYNQSPLQVAAGMVAEYLNCSVTEALVRIRTRAFVEDKTLNVIAQQILSKEILLEK